MKKLLTDIKLRTDISNNIQFEKINELSDKCIKKLEEYNGCKLGKEYRLAIAILCTDILFYDNRKQILTIPLATGTGKSTITEISMAYMYNDELLKSHSGTIILKRTIEDCNSCANNINKFAEEEIAYAYHSGKFNNLFSNNILLDELQTYPILVMTHENYKRFIENRDVKFKNKRKKVYMSDVFEWTDKRINKKKVKYNEFTRDRLIIDEEISNVVPLKITMHTIRIVEDAIMQMGSYKLFDQFQVFIRDVKRQFINSYNHKANTINFAYFENSLKRPEELDSAIFDTKNHAVKEAYMAILNLIEHGGYVRYSTDIEHKEITTYQYVDIFHPRFNKIQLDATANVNHLYEVNEEYHVQKLPDFKSYENAYLHIYDKITGSRNAINGNYANGLKEALIKDIKKHLENKEEKILIVFNDKELEKAFEESCEVDFGLSDCVSFTHYGLTTGSNQWKDYDKVLVYGINIMNDSIYPLLYHCNTKERDFNKYDTTLVPSKGARKYVEENFEKVRKGLIATDIIQTINRVKIRKYVKGKTLETHMYLINADKDVDRIIEGSLKGINILYDWDLDYKPDKKEYKDSVKNNSQKIIDCLKFIIENPEHDKVQKLRDKGVLTNKGIKKKDLRELLEFKNRPTFNNAMKKPIVKQFCDDYNIELKPKAKIIPLKTL